MSQLVAPLASPQPVRVTEATRIPMSLPNLKLAVPDIPGYFLYWHLGKNVPRAMKAGYTFVEDGDVELNQVGVANPASTTGSTDMGTRISVAAGGTVSDTDLSPERLYLMKLPTDWHMQDVASLGKKNEAVAQALRGGMSEGDPDKGKRYMKQGQDLFFPKAPKP